ncbi:MAG: hypothetical protein A2X17_00035 [Bacteroidetes bacterium GWF2_41_61]|jgi:nicotinamidase-related amidase|nr:MAG: hypothetical protein A2X20_00590 [Bacteroidetes bacterium GWE2_40_15]OFY32132.1 MAG: hypothetical protein A2X17_00035 [Bacteroidetes bacterium GWF2_41_61]OFY90327.1 MAG: hypothetical protein A2266_01965 [Bacteroidetes bacterium RIFOXYA12_FULL_40_10]PKP06455.1 MAG: nicotinamidase [Bacteroidetes bacterium HGW-Bacteroidetes-5]HBG23582.1 nicotinamidase [Rikenellaceae bacterium]
MIPNNKKRAHLVVDMLYDFINGSLACQNSFNAVKRSIEYINENPDQIVVYIADSHPRNHCSFIENGGIWPPHCIVGTKGHQVHEDFYKLVIRPQSRPNKLNILRKGENPSQEQYSGFEAKSRFAVKLGEFLISEGVSEVVISGIATEYCVKETAIDLLAAGFIVYVVKDALSYVDEKGHLETIDELLKRGVNFI